MDFFEVINSRRSVRKFKQDVPVSDEQVRKILDAAIMAPSAGNGQSWHFVVLRDKALKGEIAAKAGHQAFIDQAPVAIVVCADMERAGSKYGDRGRGTYALQETAAAVENMLLAANALSLASCWVGAFDEAKAAEILKLPSHLRPVAILPIGAPAEHAVRVPQRRHIEDVTEFR